MGAICLPSNHYFFSSAEKVREFCQPFFDAHHFSFFDYGRIATNGEFYGLTVNGDSFRILFDLEYEILRFCRDYSFEEGKFYYLFSSPSHPDSSCTDILREIYKITGSDHGFIVLKKEGLYIDIFFFSSALPYQFAVNQYINQIPIINKFIRDFYAEATDLIYAAQENKIFLLDKMLPNILTTKNEKMPNDNPYDSLPFHMTKREMDCAKYLCQGYTSKEIAGVLKLSVRTVETHLEHIKIKLKIRKKSELIKFLLQNVHLWE